MLPTPSARTLAERALKKPSSTIWLRSVRVCTPQIDEALRFYANVLGLAVGGLDVVPGTSALCARLLDAEGQPVLEVVEGAASETRSELAFVVPRRSWHLLRARLGTEGVAFAERGGTLLFADVDGRPLRVEALEEARA